MIGCFVLVIEWIVLFFELDRTFVLVLHTILQIGISALVGLVFPQHYRMMYFSRTVLMVRSSFKIHFCNSCIRKSHFLFESICVSQKWQCIFFIHYFLSSSICDMIDKLFVIGFSPLIKLAGAAAWRTVSWPQSFGQIRVASHCSWLVCLQLLILLADKIWQIEGGCTVVGSMVGHQMNGLKKQKSSWIVPSQFLN